MTITADELRPDDIPIGLAGNRHIDSFRRMPRKRQVVFTAGGQRFTIPFAHKIVVRREDAAMTGKEG